MQQKVIHSFFIADAIVAQLCKTWYIVKLDNIKIKKYHGRRKPNTRSSCRGTKSRRNTNRTASCVTAGFVFKF
jgi:hypothetical protein